MFFSLSLSLSVCLCVCVSLSLSLALCACVCVSVCVCVSLSLCLCLSLSLCMRLSDQEGTAGGNARVPECMSVSCGEPAEGVHQVSPEIVNRMKIDK